MEEKWYSKVLKAWGTGRILRTLMGVALVVGGLLAAESLLVVLGAWLLLQGLLNISCCGSRACGVSGNRKALYQDDIEVYRPKK